MLELGIIGAIVLLVGILLILIPTRFLNMIFKIFSMGTFGIRYIRRRRDHVDSLANFFLFISFLLSISFFIIPYFQYVVGAWLVFSFLCTFAQAARIGTQMKILPAKVVLFGVYLMFASGIIATTGVINNYVILSDVSFFNKAIFGGNATNLFFYLSQPYTFDILLEGLLIFSSSYILWAQFKYIRLEDTFKARWVFTYVLKILIVCAFVLGLSYFGFSFIDKVYQIDSSAKI